MAEPKFSTDFYHDGGGVLVCPKCGSSFTHQVKVVVDFRFNEDLQALRSICSSDPNTSTSIVDKNKVRGRRDDIIIHFACERGCLFQLGIMQHKGNTIIGHIE